MNIQVYDELVNWSEGKQPLVGLFVPQAAFGADAIAKLVTDRDAIRLRERWLQQRDPRFGSYYGSTADWLGDLPPTFYGVSEDEVSQQEIREGTLEAQRLFVQQELTREEAQSMLELLQDSALMREIEKAFCEERRDLYRELASGPSPELTASAKAEAESNPAVGFLLSIVVGFVMRNRESPQRAIKRVAKDTDALEALVTQDPLLIFDPLLETVWQPPDGLARLRFLDSKLSKGPRRMKRREVFDTIAGLISFVSDVLGYPLEAPEIKDLFDLAAHARTGKKFPGEQAVPPSPEAWTKMLQRQRSRWKAWLDPDDKKKNAVRALGRMAA